MFTAGRYFVLTYFLYARQIFSCQRSPITYRLLSQYSGVKIQAG